MTVHYFEPTVYHTTIGSHEPVLEIAESDSVVTSTVDAGGYDARNVQVSPRGNPQTGPFFITGAEPGDTLAVRLDRLTPTRDWGFTASAIAPNVVEPEYVYELPRRERIQWKIDREQRTTTPVSLPASLPALTISLDPMIGCFGVAPRNRQAISTATSGEHGGNMDYRGFREGITVYFPVFMPGALFHIGDAHAVQGEGEIVGTGVETSFEIQFTVNLLKGKTIHWPRGEDKDYIFAVGNARPLDQAVQHATTEMLRWLNSDYGLDMYAASMILGQCGEYDVGNVFDPAYTMVCKVNKRWLAGLSHTP